MRLSYGYVNIYGIALFDSVIDQYNITREEIESREQAGMGGVDNEFTEHLRDHAHKLISGILQTPTTTKEN